MTNATYKAPPKLLAIRACPRLLCDASIASREHKVDRTPIVISCAQSSPEDLDWRDATLLEKAPSTDSFDRTESVSFNHEKIGSNCVELSTCKAKLLV